MLIEENIRAGMPPKEAQHAARIVLGGSEQVKEQVREVRMGNWLYSVVFDCRYGARQLRKNPGFAAVAMVTLATAIGANAVVFSALNGFLLRPLNVPQSESLYGLQFGEGTRGAQSYPRQLRAIRSYWPLLCWPSKGKTAVSQVSERLLGLLATWIPARRALSIDPAILLREEWISPVTRIFRVLFRAQFSFH